MNGGTMSTHVASAGISAFGTETRQPEPSSRDISTALSSVRDGFLTSPHRMRSCAVSANAVQHMAATAHNIIVFFITAIISHPL